MISRAKNKIVQGLDVCWLTRGQYETIYSSLFTLLCNVCVFSDVDLVPVRHFFS